MKRILFILILFTFFLWGNLAFSEEPGWEELHQQAEKLRAEKSYSKALAVYEALLDLTRKTYGEKNVRVAEVLIEMALLNRYDLGNEKKYAEFQEKAKKIKLTLNSTIDCKEPNDWTYEPCRERWLGPDPCFIFRHIHTYIKVTTYGLDGSKFINPEDFIENLKGLFDKFEAMEAINLGGREATRIKLRYEQRHYRYRDGGNRQSSFLYEEFLILPMEKGFLVFNFNLNQLMPIPLNFTRDDAPQDLYGSASGEYRDWISFTESCKINP
jgi:hypothetical protein